MDLGEYVGRFLGPEPEPPPAEDPLPLSPFSAFLVRFAGVSPRAVVAAPAAEQDVWRLLGFAFMMVPIASSLAFTYVVALHTGHAMRTIVWFVWPPFLVALSLIEMLIASSVRRNLTTFAVAMLVVRLLMAGYGGYLIGESVLVALKQSAITQRLIVDERAKMNGQITHLKNGRNRIEARRRHKAEAVHVWSTLTCKAGTVACVDGHAYRLAQAIKAQKAEIANDSPTLTSIKRQITADIKLRDSLLANNGKKLLAQSDLNAREHALAELSAGSFSTAVFLNGLRLFWLAFELLPIGFKWVYVRRGTHVEKNEETCAQEALEPLRHREAKAKADEMLRTQLMVRLPQFINEITDIWMDKQLEAVKKDAVTPLRDVPASHRAAGRPAARRRPTTDTEEKMRDALRVERDARADAEERARTMLEVVSFGEIPGSRYIWKAPLKTGAFSRVMLAEDKKGNDVVIKMPLPELERSKWAWFRQEADLLPTLDHPNIVRLLDTFEFADGRPALVLEYCPEDMQTVLGDHRDHKQRFSNTEMRMFVIPIASALGYLHSRNRCHYDTTPANMAGWGSGISSDGRLIDFHFAASMPNPAEVIVGTDGYMSPQQRAGETVVPSDDLYSLAVTGFEAISGQRLFDPRAPHPQFTCERPPKATDILRICNDIAIANTLSKTLSYDRDERPATAAEFVDMLRSIPRNTVRRRDYVQQDELAPRRAVPESTIDYSTERAVDGMEEEGES